MPWNPTLIDSEILAVHAAFLNFDKILFFGGNQHDGKFSAAGHIDAMRLFDCRSLTVSEVSFNLFDLFCCGHSLTANGTLLAAGGTHAFPLDPPDAPDNPGDPFHHKHFPGLRDSAVFRFDRDGFAFHRTDYMNLGLPLEHHPIEDTGGRWYPTLVTLANGNILALSGHPRDGDHAHDNYIPEVFTPEPPPEGEWHRLGSFPDPTFLANNLTYYPRAHLLPTGHVLLVSPAQNWTRAMKVGTSPWSASFLDICEFTPREPGEGETYLMWHESSVLLPLLHENDFRPRILISGGQAPWILDLEHWVPGQPPVEPIKWKRTSPRTLTDSPRRMHGCCVLLPTGEVLSLGGIGSMPPKYEPFDGLAVRTPEIFNPETGLWSALTGPGEKDGIVRNYHSVALLMPDGRVWTAGSDANGYPGIAQANMTIEIYEPWYYGNPARPRILDAPDRWRTGEEFTLSTTQAAQIKRVVMVRCGSVTHAFDADQRLISLRFSHIGGDDLRVTAPPNGNVAPPGMYFLYTVNGQGLPSSGTTVHVSDTPQSEAEIQWDQLFGEN